VSKADVDSGGLERPRAGSGACLRHKRRAGSRAPQGGFVSALARTLFAAGLCKLGGLVLPEGGVLFLKGGEMMVFRRNGRIETRKGTRVE
jgi:hypothetical protein